MKKLKKFIKFSIYLFIFLMIIYTGIYLVASITQKLDINTSNGYYLYDSESKLINGTSDQWIKLKDISSYLIDATIAIEDKNYEDELKVREINDIIKLAIVFKGKEVKVVQG